MLRSQMQLSHQAVLSTLRRPRCPQQNCTACFISWILMPEAFVIQLWKQRFIFFKGSFCPQYQNSHVSNLIIYDTRVPGVLFWVLMFCFAFNNKALAIQAEYVLGPTFLEVALLYLWTTACKSCLCMQRSKLTAINLDNNQASVKITRLKKM